MTNQPPSGPQEPIGPKDPKDIHAPDVKNLLDRLEGFPDDAVAIMGLTVAQVREAVSNRTEAGMKLIQGARLRRMTEEGTAVQAIENPQNEVDREMAEGISVIRESMGMKDLTVAETLTFLDRGPYFGMDFVNLVRAKRAGQHPLPPDHYDEVAPMLEELGALPLDQHIHICNLTAGEALRALERLNGIGYQLAKANRQVRLGSGVSPFTPEDPFADDIAQLIEILKTMSNTATFGVMTVGEAILELEQRTAKGFELLRYHLEVLKKTGDPLE